MERDSVLGSSGTGHMNDTSGTDKNLMDVLTVRWSAGIPVVNPLVLCGLIAFFV